MKKGFTLVEVIIAASIFMVVSGIALAFSVAASMQTEINTKMAFSLAGIISLVEPIEKELGQSSAQYVGYEEVAGQTDADYSDTPDWGLNTPDLISIQANSITFRKLIRYNTVKYNRIWSKPITYQLGPNRGEIVGNGIDDNGNGFVDELCLQRIESGNTTMITTEIIFNDASDLICIQENSNCVKVEFKYMLKQGYDSSQSKWIATEGDTIITSFALTYFPPPE